MIWVYFAFIVAVSALSWRIRGGLRFYGRKAPLNKIWYSVAFACYGCLFFSWSVENWLIGFITCYVSYQLYGWGLYIGSLLTGVYALNPEADKECELIDDILYSIKITFGQTSAVVFNWFFDWLGLRVEAKTYYLYQYPKLFGFLGTTLTGLIITFLWGLFLGSLPVMLCGLGMSICYYLGYLLNKVIPEKKAGWGYGEWIFGAYLGVVLAWKLLW